LGGAFRAVLVGVLAVPLALVAARFAPLDLDGTDFFGVFARVAGARRALVAREDDARADFFAVDRELDRAAVVRRVGFFDDPRLAPARAGRFPAFFAISV
jgi:hypothetical protein